MGFITTSKKSDFLLVPPVPLEDGVRDDLFMRGGFHLDKVVELNANNTTASVNIAKINGSVEILRIAGIVTNAATLSNCTDVYLEFWNGSEGVAITKSPGATLSGLVLNSYVAKTASAASALSVINASTGGIVEPATGGRTFFPFAITQKGGADTFIRMTYTTTDAPINAHIEWHITWRPQNGGFVSPPV